MIGLVFIGDLIYCPYLEKYEKLLNEKNIEYEILYWHRAVEKEERNERYIGFIKQSKLNKFKIFKLKDFLEFRKWLKNEIIKKNYSKLILLSSLSGILIFDLIDKKYKGKYLFDIRDYSYEKIKLYYFLEKRIIRYSALTTISSKGFLKFLPKNENYIFTHNISLMDCGQKKKFIKTFHKKINFVWIGAVRYFEHQSKIIEKLDRDGRFNIIFHGSGSELELFRSFVKKRNLKNVSFTGSYCNTNKGKILEKADILNNSYTMKLGTKYALSNKFYDGIIYHIPQLVECDCYKAELLKKYPIGIGLDINDEYFAEKLYRYYNNINENEFNKTCEKLLEEILSEEKKCMLKIEKFIEGKGGA